MNKIKCPFYIRLSVIHFTKLYSELVILKHLEKKPKGHYSIYSAFPSLYDINAVDTDYINDIDAEGWIIGDTSSLPFNYKVYY